MSVLSDVGIKEMMLENKLVIGGDLSNIGPACYELSMGTIYYDLTEENRRIDASDGGSILIKPGHRVVLITKETLEIPDDIIARVASKGSLFSIGLSPVSTYADPGFSGNIGIVTQNFSDKYIKLPIGEKIAKVDFSTLSVATQTPYRGQHGFHTQIWPIKLHLQKTYEEVNTDPRVRSEEEEAFKILPRATATALRKLQRKQRAINLSIVFLLVVTTLILAALSSDYIQPIIAVVINLISSGIVGLFMWMSAKE